MVISSNFQESQNIDIIIGVMKPHMDDISYTSSKHGHVHPNVMFLWKGI